MGSRLEANSSAVRKRIEQHKFEDEEGEEYDASKFGGFGDYFRRKKIKLQNRDAARREASDKPQIFRGVVVHVNGYTQPSLNDLHDLIVDHGGGFMQYLDGKTTVTHVIAGNLTLKKKVEFRRYRIVKPAWVVDSVQAGKLLPWDRYRLVDEGIKQNVLGAQQGQIISQANSSFTGYRDQTDTSWYTGQVNDLARQIDQGREADLPFPSSQFPAAQRSQDGAEGEVKKSSQIPEDLLSEFAGEDLELTPSTPKVGADAIEDHDFDSDLDETEEPLYKSHEATRHPDSALVAPAESGISTENETPSTPPQDRADITGRDVSGRPEKKLTAEEHNALLLSDPKIWKSSVINPGFLKQYYEESRLHHLSTWKAELKSNLQSLAREQSASPARQKRPPGSRRYVFHVDFDSFFVAVSLKSHPEWVDKPAVVAHGNGPGSEIASCNYPARAFGVKNGMWMKAAQDLCPDLKILPYDFKAYEAASRGFYSSVLESGGVVQSVSVDEALIDLSAACVESSGGDGRSTSEGSVYREQARAEEIALDLRAKIRAETGCEVSVGIGGNILLAKIALRKAKPAGQYLIKPEEVLDVIGDLNVRDLPGVAYSIGSKLEEMGIKLVKDIRQVPKDRLMSVLGPKTGEKIWDYARGIDRTEVGDQVMRKSVSAEVNWGVRFVTQEQADEFVRCLSEELERRLLNEGVKGRQLMMKIMRKSADSPMDPPKHLGHGKCDVFNRSVVLGIATNDKKILAREAISIMKGYGFPPGELRGIGLQMTKLEPLKATLNLGGGQKPLQFKPASKPTPKPVFEDSDYIESPEKGTILGKHSAALSVVKGDAESNSLLNTFGSQFILPSQVDPDVLAELPEDIRSKLTKRGPQRKEDPRQPKLSFKPRSESPTPAPSDLMPSASQLDPDTLAALPEDLRTEILGYYENAPQQAPKQAVLPQSPLKTSTVKTSTRVTPTKPKGGPIASRGKTRSKKDTKSTLAQSNFLPRAHDGRVDKDSAPRTPESYDEVSAEFLAALPEDIRQELLDQQLRERLRQKGGLDVEINKKPPKLLEPQQQQTIQLDPRPARPTFTSMKLSSLPELREAISAWFQEFRSEEPDSDDVSALATYLRRVVLEERDMNKATSIVKWLTWIVGQDDSAALWTSAVEAVQTAVQTAVKERGLGAVYF